MHLDRSPRRAKSRIAASRRDHSPSPTTRASLEAAPPQLGPGGAQAAPIATTLLLATIVATLFAACREESSTCADRLGELCDAPRRYISLAAVADHAVSVDLDGDGQAEIVTLGRKDRTLGVSWADGRTDTVALGRSRLYLYLASGDLDGDGQADIVIAADDPPRLLRMHNRDGVLVEGEAVELDTEPTALAMADLDGDGSAELLVGVLGGLTLIHGDDERREVAAGETPVAMQIADLDGDGALDLAVVDFEGGSLELLRGDGAGGLSPLASIPLGLAPEDLDIADINSDGAPDIVVRSRLNAAPWVVEGDGSGGFRPPWPMNVGAALGAGRGVIAFPGETSDLFAVATPGALMHVTVSDGSPDPVATADVDSFDEAMLIGDGFISSVGSVGSLYTFDVVGGPNPVVVGTYPFGAPAAGDVDRDGYADLVIARWQEGSCELEVRWGGPEGLGEEATPVGPISDPSRLSVCPLHLRLADLNDDGELDLLAIGQVRTEIEIEPPQSPPDLPEPLPETWIAVGLGVGDGSFELRPELRLTAANWATPTILEGPAATLLILPQESAAEGAVVVRVDEAGDLYPQGMIAEDRTVWSAAAGDIDGDLQADLVLRSGVDDPRLEVYYGVELVEGPRYSAAQLGLVTDESSIWGESFVLSDLDDDGAAEALLCQYDADAERTTLRIVGGLGDAPEVLETAEYEANLNHLPGFFADLDGDGDDDVGLWGSDGLSVVYRDTQGLSEEPRTLPLLRSGTGEAADFDGDGSLDIATTTARGTVVIELRDVSLPNPRGVRLLPGPGLFSPALVRTAHGDCDGDGLDEVMIGAHGQLTTAWGDGGVFARATSEALDGDILRDLKSVDIDGDGDVELLTLTSGVNTYSVHVRDWREGGWRTLQTIEGTSNGMAFALTVDDLDGDGVIDLAVAATAAAVDIFSFHAIYGRLDPLGTLLLDQSVTATVAIDHPSPSLSELSRILTDPARIQSADLDGDDRAELLLSAGQHTLLLWNEGERRWRGEELPYTAAWITDVGEYVALRERSLVRVPVVGREHGRAARIGETRAVSVYAVDDCDGDGRGDLVTASSTFSQLWLARNSSYVPFEGLRSRSTISSQNLRCDDVNQDGIVDIVGAIDLGVLTWMSETP